MQTPLLSSYTLCTGCLHDYVDHRLRLEGSTSGRSTNATTATSSRVQAAAQGHAASRSSLSAAAASSIRVSDDSDADDAGIPPPISAFPTMYGPRAEDGGTTNSRRKASYERPRNEQQMRTNSHIVSNSAHSSPGRKGSLTRQQTLQVIASHARKGKGKGKAMPLGRTIYVFIWPFTVSYVCFPFLDCSFILCGLGIRSSRLRFPASRD